jgi:hypothetical protein
MPTIALGNRSGVILARYTAYMLDDRGNILSREDIEADDDTAAIEAGRHLVGAHSSDTSPPRGVEVWHGTQRIFSSHPKSG